MAKIKRIDHIAIVVDELEAPMFQSRNHRSLSCPLAAARWSW